METRLSTKLSGKPKQPFRYQPSPGVGKAGVLWLRRAATESEIIEALKELHNLDGNPTIPVADVSSLRTAVADLCEKPREDVKWLRPLFPNTREMLIKLIENKDQETAEAKWTYLYQRLKHLYETLIAHFLGGAATAASSEGWQPDAEVVKELLFKRLSAFGSLSENDEIKLPDRVWRDLTFARGTSLKTEFWEYVAAVDRTPPSNDPVGDLLPPRRDADLRYTEDEKFLGTGANDGNPPGWKSNTPWPTKLPRDHVFDKKGNPKAWRARWTGVLRIPESTRGQTVWLAHNLEPLTDNGLRVKLTPKAGGASIEIDDWKTGYDPQHNHQNHHHPTALEHTLVTTPLNGFLPGYYDIKVQFYDNAQATDAFDAKFALCWATGAAQPTTNAFQPIPSTAFFFNEGAQIKGKDHFDKAYQRTWKAVYYAHALRLTRDEIAWFSDNPESFQGRHQTYGEGPLASSQRFDLNVLFPLPATGISLCLLNQWEHLRDYTELRGIDQSNAAERFAQFKTVFELTDLNLDAARQSIAMALWNDTDHGQASLVGECLAYWENRILVPADLRNEIWLRRIKRFVELLQHSSVWMQPGKRFTGDLMQLIAAKPLTPAAADEIRDLFLEAHPSGDSKHLDLVNGLRLRGRAALLAYLAVRGTRHEGQAFTGGSVDEWSRALLLDLECGVENRLSRIQSVIVSCQRFVREQEMKQPSESQSWRSAWEHLSTYAVWLGKKDQELYPENYIDFIPAKKKSTAFRLLESRLQRNQLSLLRPVDDNPNPPSLDWLEEVEREARANLEQTLKSTLSARDPHAGWLAPAGAGFPDGWTPGPFDLESATLFDGASSLQGFRFLLWPVMGRSQEFAEPKAPEAYKPPGENGEVTLTLEQRCTIRIGWSYQITQPGPHQSDVWSQPFWTDSVITAPQNSSADVLTVFQMGETLRVAVGNLGGLDIAVKPLLPHLVSARMSSVNAVTPATATNSFTYGGMLKLPLAYAGDVPALPGYDQVAAPVVGDATEIPPVFGLGTSERNHHAFRIIAQKLEQGRHFAEAREWLSRAKSLETEFAWNRDPDAQTKASTLRHIELLQGWGDSLMARNTEENLRQAEIYYREASRLLGSRPRKSKCLPSAAAGTIAAADLADAPLNARLLGLWEVQADRLAKIHYRRTATGTARPRLDFSADVFRLPNEAGGFDPLEWSGFRPHYRYSYLHQKALDFANELKGFGAALLSAFEKGDSEHLSALRAAYETQIGYASLDIKQRQWAEAETQWRVLRQNRFNAEFRKRFYEELIAGGLNGGEHSHLNLLEAAEDLTLAAQVLELAAQAIALIPDLTAGGAGISSPVAIAKLTGGEKISAMMNFAAKALHTFAGKQQSDASQAVTSGGYYRRRRQWEHDRDREGLEIRALERQIDATGQRLDISKRELNIQHQQLANSHRMAEFMRTKFTSAELYDWMQQELLGLHHRMAGLAIDLAKQAEQAYRYERHFSTRRFIQSENLWSHHRFGLMSGEHLVMSLRAMDKTHMDENLREHELTTQFSLRWHAPAAMAALRLTGLCEVDIPEWFYDMENPGTYRRRIKTVAVTVPCATGPYQTVNCTLTLLSDATRLSASPHPQYEEDRGIDGDRRFVRRYAAHQTIRTTSAQNDPGMFETNLRDERYLPFEGAGAISKWRIEIDPESNQFDPESLTDVVLNIRYTCTEEGSELQTAAKESARRQLPCENNPGYRYLDLRQDYPSQWSNQAAGIKGCCLAITREMFPWERHLGDIMITAIDIHLAPDPTLPLQAAIKCQAEWKSTNGKRTTIMLLPDAHINNTYHATLDLTSDPALQAPIVQAKAGSECINLVFDPSILALGLSAVLKYHHVSPTPPALPCCHPSPE